MSQGVNRLRPAFALRRWVKYTMHMISQGTAGLAQSPAVFAGLCLSMSNKRDHDYTGRLEPRDDPRLQAGLPREYQ